LDQIFSNLPFTDLRLESLPQTITDHVQISCTFEFRKNEKDYDLSNPSLRITQSQIKSLAIHQETQGKLLDLENITDIPTRALFEEKLMPERRIDQWY
jgi:hypothetical protein